MDLFEDATAHSHTPGSEPLAARMRPRTLDEYAGQDHIIGPGRLLRRAIQADQLSSLIFYGPPGTGKTTLARVIANTTKSRFATLNAVLSGVKQIREEIEAAQEQRNLYDRRTILFVDEVHRWNKSQQDALLPWVENGTFILIGATTENPYFEVNSALVSRSRIFQLRPLEGEDLEKILAMTLADRERGYGKWQVELAPEARRHLIDVAGGDARSLLNALELAVETTPESFPPPEGTVISIPLEAAEESIQKKALLYDKEGDYHFDTISAFIKSLRGSDPDAALYWMARMVRSGEDPRFLFRRMLISACEDIGLADPQALVVVQAAAAAFDRIGMPEGAFHLTQAALYLATAPKSNSALGYFDALKVVEEEQQEDVPAHLKDPNRDGRDFGHGKGYLYPHAYRDHWTAQQYLPAALKGRLFYKPGALGLEGQRRHTVLERREEQLESILAVGGESGDDPILTFSPRDRQREEWINRVGSRRGRANRQMCRRLLEEARISRHDRLLLPGVRTGIVPGEALRRVPEGLVWIIAGSREWYELLTHYLQNLDPAEMPRLDPPEAAPETLPEAAHFGDVRFEAVLADDWLTRRDQWQTRLSEAAGLLSPGGQLLLMQTIPSRAPRLSRFLSDPPASTAEVLEKVRAAEEALYASPADPRTGWDAADLSAALKETGWTLIESREETITSDRVLDDTLLETWLPEKGAEGGRYAKAVTAAAGVKDYEEYRRMMYNRLGGKRVPWEEVKMVITARVP